MLRLERWQALLVAALSIVTPWLVLSTTLLNVTPAYPLTTALVWAVVRAVTRPSVTGDLLVLGIAVLNGLARTGHVPFIAIAAVAVAVQVWRDRPEGVPVGAALRAYPLRFVRTHPVLVGAGAIALAAVLALGVSRIVGGQYQGAIPRDYGVDRAFDRAGMWGAMLVLGSGYIAAIIGVPWLLRQAARPTDRVAGAFAVTAVSLFVVFVAATWQAPSEERYVAVLAGLAPVAFGAAVFRREASAIGALLAGLVVLRIVSRNVTPFDEGGFSWIVLPARQFLFRFLDTRLTQAGVPEGWSAYLIVLVLAIGVAVAVAYVCSGRRASMRGGPGGPRSGRASCCSSSARRRRSTRRRSGSPGRGRRT
jgi:hypothetical protein